MAELTFAELRPEVGRTHEADDGTTIGREACDIVLDDPEVSRRHAILRVVGGATTVEDLGSRNGTFVNGERIEGASELRVGDTVRFGNAEWRLESGPGAPETALHQPTAAPETVPPPAESLEAAEPLVAGEPPAAGEPPSEIAVSEQRGDVPPPPDPAASAVRAAPAPAPKPGGAPAFASAGAATSTPRRGSAARSGKATAIALGVVLADAIAMIVYFAAR